MTKLYGSAEWMSAAAAAESSAANPEVTSSGHDCIPPLLHINSR